MQTIIIKCISRFSSIKNIKRQKKYTSIDIQSQLSKIKKKSRNEKFIFEYKEFPRIFFGRKLS